SHGGTGAGWQPGILEFGEELHRLGQRRQSQGPAQRRDAGEALALLDDVSQLAIAVGELDAADMALETMRDERAVTFADRRSDLRERRQGDRKLDDVHASVRIAREPRLEAAIRPLREPRRPSGEISHIPVHVLTDG